MLPVLFDAHTDPGFFVHMLGALGAGLRDLSPIPRCIPCVDGLAELRASRQPFNLLIPMLNSIRPVRSHALEHSLANVAPEVNSGICRVFLDFSNEATHPKDLELLVQRARAAGITVLENLTLICQNRRIPALNSPIRHACFDAFLVAGWLSCRKLLVEENQSEGVTSSSLKTANPQHDILCLNATPRFHRLVTLLSLAAEGFIDLDAPDYAPNCQIPYISYPGLEYEKREQAEPLRLNEVSELLTQRGNSELIPFLPRLLARAPLRVDAFDE